VPAAAVIPAPIAYIKVVAVKKLVVGFLLRSAGVHYVYYQVWSWHPLRHEGLYWLSSFQTFTLRKLECSRQASALNTLAWNNNIGPSFYFVGF
jgi:hypothetical protein